MKFNIITIGSRGDVQPFIALCKALQKRGHETRITTFLNFKDFIEGEEIEFFPLAGDAVEVIRLLIGENVTTSEYFRNLEVLLNPVKEQFFDDIEQSCKNMDAVIYSTLGSVVYHVAEKYNLPVFRVAFCPLDPTWEFPAMTAPYIPGFRAYNRFTFWMGDRLWSHATRKLCNDWRQELGLKRVPVGRFPYRKLHGKEIPTLYAYSSLIAPKPKEYKEYHHLTGFWIKELEENYVPEKSLQEFLERGEKPIYIGVGSMVGKEFQNLFDIVMESLRITGKRAILSSGWGNLEGVDVPDTVYQIKSVPHEWLFTKVAAVIHHGGAGTTAAGIRAGVPTVIVPFGGDQPYWGRQVHRMNIGTKPILRKSLTVRNLSAAIMEVTTNQEMIAQAKIIGQKLREENGAENAVAVIEKELHEAASGRSARN